MFVHISPATLRRHPILGVTIGVATAGVITWLLVSGADEARTLLAQKAPEPVSVHDVVNLPGIRWVTVSGGDWHCDGAITIKRRSAIERMVLGQVGTTEVPITGTSERELLVASFDGAVNCEQRVGSTLTGVVGSTQIFGSCTARSHWRRTGNRVVVLDVGASPRRALIMIAALLMVALGGVVFAGYYLRLMFLASEPRSVPAYSVRPIEPN